MIESDAKKLTFNVIEEISLFFNCDINEIQKIESLKKGMTNNSYIFTHHGINYIVRIPGEGTDKIINRHNELEVYRAIEGKGICDDLVYFNAESGLKISRYLENVRCCNCLDLIDLNVCMKKLKDFHDLKLQVHHTFDLFGNIEFYEKLRGKDSIYKDYYTTKRNVLKLRNFISNNIDQFSLSHIDSVPDNFLFHKDSNGNICLQLTDWEYAGMQDPHVDIAMFCIYSLYDLNNVDKLIDIYFNGNVSKKTRIKIYCYIAVCGLLWSNWCEYKSSLGIEFGDYSICQYRYAKDYYSIAIKEMEKL